MGEGRGNVSLATNPFYIFFCGTSLLVANKCCPKPKLRLPSASLLNPSFAHIVVFLSRPYLRQWLFQAQLSCSTRSWTIFSHSELVAEAACINDQPPHGSVPIFPVKNTSVGWSRWSVKSLFRRQCFPWNSQLKYLKLYLCGYLFTNAWNAFDKSYWFYLVFSLQGRMSTWETFHRCKPEFTGKKSVRFHTVLYNQPF